MFTTHTVQTAPEGSRAAMTEAARRVGGKVPDVLARLANSPDLLTGFLDMSARFENCSLPPIAQEVVIMTVAVRNDCRVCIGIHTGKLRALNASGDLIAALREQQPLPDSALEAIRSFTIAVLETSGGIQPESRTDFLAHGYTERNALDIVLGIGTYTMSTLANRLVEVA